MSRHRKFYGAMVLVSVVIFFIGHLLTRPPATYNAQDGPTVGQLRTEGVFRPGGYVEFTLSPEIQSLRGKYRGTVKTAAVEAVGGVEAVPLWPEDTRAFGRDWGGSFSGGTDTKTFTVTHRVGIPNEEDLKGAPVAFVVDYDIWYPAPTGGAPGVNRYYFEDRSEDVREVVVIELGGETLSSAEIAWMRAQGGAAGIVAPILAVIALGLFFFGLFRFIAPPQG